MRRTLILVLALFVAAPSIAATLSWTAPTQYTDTTAIAPSDIARITYTPYYGSSATGPWTAGTVTAAGALTATVPDPVVGGTRWYTVEATLDGQTSAKGVAASKTVPFPKVPAVPSSLTVQ